MLSITLILIALPTLLLILLYRNRRKSRLVILGDKFPGPAPLPLIGNSLEFGVSTDGFFSNIIRLTKEYGPAFRVWIGPRLFVILSDPDDAEVILSSNKYIQKSLMYTFLEPWLGTGLLTSTGAKWHKNRKIITPAFHFKILDQFVEVFNSNGDILIEKLSKEANGQEFDIYNYITLYALDVICETAMGVSINAQHDSESHYVNAIKMEADVVLQRIFKPWLMPDLLLKLTKYSNQQSKALSILHDTTNKVIQMRRKNFESKPSEENNKDEDADIGQKKRLAFLDLLLNFSMKDPTLSDQNIREEVDTFMFEGHDTTTSGISFILWLLSNHPDVQDRVYEEISEVFQAHDSKITLNSLQEMKYLEMVIKEGLRLFPSVPFYGRESQEEIKIKTGNYIIPPKATIIVSAYSLHQNGKHFPNPEKFDPDRFLPDNAQGRHPYCYVPFSAGPRNCIGQKFAMLEMKAAVSKVVNNYKLLPGSNKNLDLTLTLILKSMSGIKVKIVPRI